MLTVHVFEKNIYFYNIKNMSQTEGEYGFEIDSEVHGSMETEDVTAMDVVETMVTLAATPVDLFGNPVRQNDIITFCTSNAVRIGRVTGLTSTYFQVEPISQIGASYKWRKCGQKRTFRAGSRFVVITPIAKNIAVIV